jgi:hypothetical protein
MNYDLRKGDNQMAVKSNKTISYDKSRMVIPRKPNRFVVVYLIIFLITILEGSVTMAAEPNEDTSRKVIEPFLKKSAENKITRLEVYYMELDISTRIDVTESSLRDNYYEYKVIARDPNLVEVAKALREFKYEDIYPDISNFRLGYVFYDNNEEVLRLFFPHFTMVAVNGVGYKATPELVRALTQFLPVKAYKEMNEFIEEQERQFPSAYSKQKAIPNEQKKSDKP